MSGPLSVLPGSRATSIAARTRSPKAFEEVWDTWDRFEFQEAEVRDLGDSVVWLGRVQMQGKASEIILDQEFACHFAFRDARVARVDAFLTWAEALEAAELGE